MNTTSKRSEMSEMRRSGHEFGFSAGSGRALADAAETWFSTTAEWQREMMSFVSMRLRKDGEATREAMVCRDLADMQAVQSRWIEETVRDYNAEMTKLMAICAKSVNGGGRPGG